MEHGSNDGSAGAREHGGDWMEQGSSADEPAGAGERGGGSMELRSSEDYAPSGDGSHGRGSTDNGTGSEDPMDHDQDSLANGHGPPLPSASSNGDFADAQDHAPLANFLVADGNGAPLLLGSSVGHSAGEHHQAPPANGAVAMGDDDDDTSVDITGNVDTAAIVRGLVEARQAALEANPVDDKESTESSSSGDVTGSSSYSSKGGSSRSGKDSSESSSSGDRTGSSSSSSQGGSSRSGKDSSESSSSGDRTGSSSSSSQGGSSRSDKDSSESRSSGDGTGTSSSSGHGGSAQSGHGSAADSSTSSGANAASDDANSLIDSMMSLVEYLEREIPTIDDLDADMRSSEGLD